MVSAPPSPSFASELSAMIEGSNVCGCVGDAFQCARACQPASLSSLCFCVNDVIGIFLFFLLIAMSFGVSFLRLFFGLKPRAKSRLHWQKALIAQPPLSL